MIWIDIGVALLLTLRMTLSSPALPQLLDPNDDDVEVNELSPPKS